MVKSTPKSRPAGTRPWHQHAARWPALITLGVIASAAVDISPIREASTMMPALDADLQFPLGYTLLAPLSSVLDTLTLLTVEQHIAIGVWLIGLYIAVRVSRVAWLRRSWTARGEVLAAVIAFAGLFLTYAAAAFLPRPMARLETKITNVFTVDFHAHTNFSHDGQSWFTPERVRRWYGNAGFDVAFITDHRTVEGAAIAYPNNPRLAGQGTTLLPGLEVVWRGEHVNILGAEMKYRGLTTPDLRDMDEQALVLASSLANAEPIIIETLPGDLSRMIIAAGPGTPGVRAIELIDGAPRGLSQTRRERARIVQLADSFDIAVVAGSDNHGFGYAAAGWTLMAFPQWRSLSADSLASAIDVMIRRGGRNSTLVIERRVASSSGLALAVAPLAIGWRMMTALNTEQRVMWVVWIWAFAGAQFALRWHRLERAPA